jgi:hypothetical protein
MEERHNEPWEGRMRREEKKYEARRNENEEKMRNRCKIVYTI